MNKKDVNMILEEYKTLQLECGSKDSYSHGLYNGLELARISLIKNSKSKFLGIKEFKKYGEKIMKEFNADEITLDNFEGIKQCVKRPLIVHALQLNFPEGFKVTTPEGEMKGKPGDYLMFGIRGEKYPCDKEIFEETYDIVHDTVGLP